MAGPSGGYRRRKAGRGRRTQVTPRPVMIGGPIPIWRDTQAGYAVRGVWVRHPSSSSMRSREGCHPGRSPVSAPDPFPVKSESGIVGRHAGGPGCPPPSLSTYTGLLFCKHDTLNHDSLGGPGCKQPRPLLIARNPDDCSQPGRCLGLPSGDQSWAILLKATGPRNRRAHPIGLKFVESLDISRPFGNNRARRPSATQHRRVPHKRGDDGVSHPFTLGEFLITR